MPSPTGNPRVSSVRSNESGIDEFSVFHPGFSHSGGMAALMVCIGLGLITIERLPAHRANRFIVSPHPGAQTGSPAPEAPR